MSIVPLIGIAIALAMDAFAVAIAVGVGLKDVSHRQTFRLSFHFGLFQALMPLIGWSLGLTVRDYIVAYDHWIAFGLLALVGSNMIKEAIWADEEVDLKKDPTKGFSLVTLSIATSIDALAVGLSMSMLQISIIFPVIIIGIVALIFTIFGLFLGKVAAGFKQISTYAEIIGGIVLWAIGFKILSEHGVFKFLLT